MQSKFWAVSSSGISSDEESSIESTEEITETRKPAITRWIGIDSSSSSENDKRFVKSLKDRRWSDMRDTIKQMNNHMKICDYSELHKDYEMILKCLSRSAKVIENEGIPKFFVRAIVELENFLEEKYRDKESFKKLSKTKATAFNTLRAKVRKVDEEWKEYIEKCRENPSKFLSSESGSGDDEDASYSDDDYDGYDSEYDDSGGSEDAVQSERSDEDVIRGEKSDNENEESDWYNRDRSNEYSDNGTRYPVELKDKSSKPKKKHTTDSTKKKSRKHKHSKLAKESIRLDSKMSQKELEDIFETSDLTAELIQKRVRMIVEKRGRRGVDRYEQRKILKRLTDLALKISPQCHLEVVGHLISAEFDTATGLFSCLTSNVWMETYDYIQSILDTMKQHPDTYFTPFIHESTYADDDKSKSNLQKTVHTVLTSFIEGLCDELTKALQFTSIHADEYKERLSQSVMLLALLWKGFKFLLQRDYPVLASNLALRILENMHWKSETLSSRMWELAKKYLPEDLFNTIPDKLSNTIEPRDIINDLINTVFVHGDQSDKTRALLYSAYNKSLNNDYYEAKDLLQTTNVHELAMQMDVQTKILYNRNLVQLGISAFRHGFIDEAHNCLAEVCGMNKQKELLAQGISNLKNVEKTVEQERAEKRRLLPYHMHISLEIIEGIHYICAMLLEVPHIAANPYENRRRPISKQFCRLLDFYDRQVFSGPPENSREIIVAATKALQKGNWIECCKYIFKLNIWDKFKDKEAVQKIIEERIKQEAMKTYIFTYSTLYDSFSVDQLSNMFDLPKNDVHSIVSRLMVNEEIHASWDQSSNCILINRMEPSRLQQLSMQLASSINSALEQNELTLNMKNPKFVMTQERRLQQRDTNDNRHMWGMRNKDNKNMNREGNMNFGNFKDNVHKKGFYPVSLQNNKLQRNKNMRSNNKNNASSTNRNFGLSMPNRYLTETTRDYISYNVGY